MQDGPRTQGHYCPSGRVLTLVAMTVVAVQGGMRAMRRQRVPSTLEEGLCSARAPLRRWTRTIIEGQQEEADWRRMKSGEGSSSKTGTRPGERATRPKASTQMPCGC